MPPMSLGPMLAVLNILCSLAWGVYVSTGIMSLLPRFHHGLPGWLRRWTFRLRWIIWTADSAVSLADNIIDDAGLSTRLAWAFAVTVGWFLCMVDRHDDDFWKRKRKRAADAVKAIGHRLVVVPAQ